MEIILQPWPWYVAGPGIALVMTLLVYFGKSFGISSNLRTMCAAFGAGKYAEFFRFDWKAQKWNLIFIAGAVIGGFVSNQYLMESEVVALNPKTIAALEAYGLSNVAQTYLPTAFYGLNGFKDIGVFLYLLLGGVLVGFGTRYAGGCTSGHAISGLSNLQVPSLVAVIGFFIGGLTMVHLIFPLIF